MNIMDNLHKMRSFFKQKLNIAIIGAGRAENSIYILYYQLVILI